MIHDIIWHLDARIGERAQRFQGLCSINHHFHQRRPPAAPQRAHHTLFRAYTRFCSCNTSFPLPSYLHSVCLLSQPNLLFCDAIFEYRLNNPFSSTFSPLTMLNHVSSHPRAPPLPPSADGERFSLLKRRAPFPSLSAAPPLWGDGLLLGVSLPSGVDQPSSGTSPPPPPGRGCGKVPDIIT